MTSDGKLPYRLLTGTDDRAFCEKVSAALADGYVLYGSPSLTHDGDRVVAAQAVVLPDVLQALQDGGSTITPSPSA